MSCFHVRTSVVVVFWIHITDTTYTYKWAVVWRRRRFIETIASAKQIINNIHRLLNIVFISFVRVIFNATYFLDFVFDRISRTKTNYKSLRHVYAICFCFSLYLWYLQWVLMNFSAESKTESFAELNCHSIGTMNECQHEFCFVFRTWYFSDKR